MQDSALHPGEQLFGDEPECGSGECGPKEVDVGATYIGARHDAAESLAGTKQFHGHRNDNRHSGGDSQSSRNKWECPRNDDAPKSLRSLNSIHPCCVKKHWIGIGTKTAPENLPKIFYVNWFRKADDGKWLWPGYGENSRVLKWVFERCAGTGKARKTQIGFMPTPDAIDTSGLSVSEADMNELLDVNTDEWKQEVLSIREHYARFGDRLPGELMKELEDLEKRLG